MGRDRDKGKKNPLKKKAGLEGAKGGLTLMGLFSITAAMVMSVHEYPTFAVAGMRFPFFLIATGFLWFLPVALCSAEMATVEGWEEGGIFSWVGGMLGERFGFAAIFFQWFQITVCFVTIIYFMLSALSYVFNFQAVNDNPLIKFIGVLVIFWVLTFVQLGGIRRTVQFAKYGFFIGVVTPTVLLILFSVLYLAGGRPLQISFNAKELLPDLTKLSTMVVFVSIIFANMGVEASASHVNEMKNPKRDYPAAMLLLLVLATLLNIIGGLAVAGAVPLKELSFSAGMVQTYESLILGVNQNLGWVVKLICAMLVVGVLGEVSSWIVGPSRGMAAASERGLLPDRVRGLNKNGVPAHLVLVQGGFVTVWAAVLTFGGGGNNLSYIAAISLTTVIYLAGYLMLFISYVKLSFHTEIKRGYHVPGGRAGKILFSAMGFLSSLFALVIAFVPPSVLSSGDYGRYELMLGGSFVVTLMIPFLVYAFYGEKHSRPGAKPQHLASGEVNRFARLLGRGEHRLRKK